MYIQLSTHARTRKKLILVFDGSRLLRGRGVAMKEAAFKLPASFMIGV